MLRLDCPPSTQLYLRSTVDTALQILRQMVAVPVIIIRTNSQQLWPIDHPQRVSRTDTNCQGSPKTLDFSSTIPTGRSDENLTVA
jgi:hypothetical protein